MVRGRMRAVATLEEAMKGAAYVQENTPEVVDIKKDMFARLDALAGPDTDTGQLDLRHPAVQIHRTSEGRAAAAWWCIPSIRPT